MNLRTCPACQREISPRATTCPHCGDPLTASKGIDTTITGNARSCFGCVMWSAIILVGAGIVGMLFGA